MEEADAFIREASKHIQCSFADDDDIEFSTPQIFEFLVRCIWKIDPSSKSTIPSYIYPNVITARLHLGNAISDYLQKFRIRGDTALHTVLYGNINNLRSAFIELIRKLPADTAEIASQDEGKQFLENVADELESQPKWVPVYCRGLNNKKEWKLPNDHPEVFPLSHSDEPAKHFDPRQWISQYINSSHIERSVKPQRPKPSLPPKPVFANEQKNTGQEPVKEQVEVTEEIDENAILQAEYDRKLEEYRKLQEKSYKIEEQNKALQTKLSEFDPELIEALSDPERYVQRIAIKVDELNKQMEEDTLTLENRQKEAAKRKLEYAEEMKKMGIHDEEMRRVREMENALQGLDEQLESNKMLANKLCQKLAKTDENQERAIYDYEKRSKELDELVRKQEADMLKRQEERATLRAQEERDSEAVNRSFAIIYNILLQHCDHYRGRLAMESFTRIHLYCMEILEMLRDNGAMKQTVGLLETEILVEEQKQYGKKFELLSRDYEEIKDLNDKLFSEIQLKNPDFQMPAV